MPKDERYIDILETLYPRDNRDEEHKVISVWKDTKYILDKFNKYNKERQRITRSSGKDRFVYGMDDLMMLLIDYFINGEKSQFIDEVNYIKDKIFSEFQEKEK
jgi:hypothetical protein